jgi:hypothetical protein
LTLRFYLDEDGMDRDLVRALRTQGVDLVTASEAGMINRPDDQHLEYAASQGCVLFSYNARDYFRLHSERMAAGQSHAGIVLAPQQRYSVGEQARRLMRLAAARQSAAMLNCVEFLSGWG